jgi:hypothetical protein
MRLTGPQQIVLGDANADGLIFRGEHNQTCKELRLLGLVKYDPQPSPYPQSNPNPQTAWRLTPEGRALDKHTRANAAPEADPKLKRGQVWCRSCGVTQMVDSANALRHGWPKCACNGHTMTLDSPDEQPKR